MCVGVANFHLGNGAAIYRINHLGDTSAKGLQQSAGLMVNYWYSTDLRVNREAYTQRGAVACMIGPAAYV